MNLTLLKSASHKYNYVALLSNGLTVCFEASKKIGDEVELSNVDIVNNDLTLRILHVKENEIIGTGEIAWSPKP